MFLRRLSTFLAALLLTLTPLGNETFHLNVSSVVFAANENYQTTANLNLRTGAGTTYKVVTIIPKGKQVTLISKHGTWYKVSYSSKTGYVSSMYLKQITTASTPKPQTVKYSTTANLNLRAGGGTTYKVVTVIPKGKQVALLSKHGTWYKVTYSSKTGYVSSAYLKQITSTTTPIPNSPSVKYTTIANLNLRTGAGTNYKVITVIPKGNQVSFISKYGTWYKVNFSEKIGYVSSQYLKLMTSDNPILTVKNGITYVDGVIIANKRYSLPSTYNPGESKEAHAAFNKMLADAKKNNISFQIISGFRSYEYQKNLFNRYVKSYGEAEASRFSAKAGHSEHQTGLAFDFGGPNQTHWLKESFDKTAEGKWLAANAHRFGFIMRYPKGKESVTGYMYEPWHFRYVGVDRATKITKTGKTMEEYYGFLGK